MGQEIRTGSERFLQRVMFSHIYADICRFSDSLFYSFASAFSRLMELGVPTSQFVTSEPWELKTLDEQETK